ncbi:MAG: protein-disulfide reductase DsbD domain-containing protein [Hyphomicrobiaceae bacterium]
MTGALAACLAALTLQSVPSSAEELAESEWVTGHYVRTRLIAGGRALQTSGEGGTGGPRLAALEIQLDPGWKTYWRVPGDAGGVPPEFDWSGSENLAHASVLFPAPMRMTDRAGTTIGYKGAVVLPVLVEAVDASAPVRLKLGFTFGVCREICVPSEAQIEVPVPQTSLPPPEPIAAALSLVPRSVEGDGKRPVLARVVSDLAGASPKIELHVSYPMGVEGADVFVHEPGGEYVPQPVRVRQDGNLVVFAIDLTMGADLAALKDKPVVATIVSNSARAEAAFRIDGGPQRPK